MTAPGPLTRADGLHWSDLSKLALSPAHYRAAVLGNMTQTAAMARGTLVHGLALGGLDVVVYDGTRRGKDWEAFKAANGGRTIVTVKEHADASVIVRALRADPAWRLFEGGQGEIVWERETMHGRRCAGRIDYASPKRLVELKTTRFAHPAAFARECRRRNYHAQLAWYERALALVGHHVEERWIVGIESAPPYPVVAFRLTDALMQRGDEQNAEWLAELERCEASGDWPGYATGPLELDVEESDTDAIGLVGFEDEGEAA